MTRDFINGTRKTPASDSSASTNTRSQRTPWRTVSQDSVDRGGEKHNTCLKRTVVKHQFVVFPLGLSLN